MPHSSIPSTLENTLFFPRFNELPSELRRFVWYLALPGPRIVYVQRRPTSGQDMTKEWFSGRDTTLPVPNYFMSPSSSKQIVALLQTCRESSYVARENYTLLFPASSTWFSFAADFLYLDFGRRSFHILSYKPRHFTASIPDPYYIANSPELSRYLRPIFNEELAKKVKNLVISTRYSNEILNELVTVFTGVKVLVIADQLYNICCEDKEEFVWLRGQVGDEIGSTARLEVDPHGTGQWRELEKEKKHRHLLLDLLLWRGLVRHGALDDMEVDHLLQEWKTATARVTPTVLRKTITTIRAKNWLLAICGSDDNFLALTGLDWGFIEGRHEYCGPLNLSQQLDYLELATDRITTTCELGCAEEEGGNRSMDDIPFLLYRIDMLVLERMRSLEDAKLVKGQ